MAPASVATPAAAPVSAPAATPASTAQVPAAPTPFAVRPLIDAKGKPVTSIVESAKPAAADPAADVVSFDELDKPGKKPAPKAEEKPKEAEATADPAKPDDKEAEKPKPFEVKKTEVRDYSDLSPEDEALARRLPNKLHDAFRDRLKRFKAEVEAKDKEIAEAKQAAARFTHDHPEAFKLDPSYNEAVAEYEAVRSEQDFYTAQLVKAQAGQDWAYIKGFDQNGSPILEEVEANGRVDSTHISTIQRAINALGQKEQSIQQKAHQIKTSYANSVAEVQNHYKVAREKLFPGIVPEKLAGQEKEIYDLVMQSLPLVEQRRPAAQMQALAAVVVLRANLFAQQQAERAERAERIAGTATAAAPVKPPVQPAALAQAGEVIKWEDLDKPAR